MEQKAGDGRSGHPQTQTVNFLLPSLSVQKGQTAANNPIEVEMVSTRYVVGDPGRIDG